MTSLIPDYEIFTRNLPAFFVKEVKAIRSRLKEKNDFIAYAQSLVKAIIKFYSKDSNYSKLKPKISDEDFNEIIKTVIRLHFFTYNSVNARPSDLKRLEAILKRSSDPIIQSWYAIFFFEEWRIEKRFDYIQNQYNNYQQLVADGKEFSFFDKLDIHQFLGYLAFQKYDFPKFKELTHIIYSMYESEEMSEDLLLLTYKTIFSSILGYHNALIGDFQDADFLIGIAEAFAEELNLPYLKSQVKSNLGSIYTYKGNLIEGIEQFKEALVLAQKVGNDYSAARIKANTGVTQLSLGFYDEALTSFLEVKKYAEDAVGIAPLNFHTTILLNIADTYKVMGKYQEALNFLDEALIMEEQNEAITANLLSIYYHQIDVLHEADNLLEARKTLEKLKKAMVKIDATPMGAIYNYMLGILESKEANFASAKRVLLEAIRLSEEQTVMHLGPIRLKASFQLANVLLNSYKFTNNNEELQQALSLLENLVKTAEEKNLTPMLIDCLIVRAYLNEILDFREGAILDLEKAHSLAEEYKLPIHLTRAKERFESLSNSDPKLSRTEKTNGLLDYLGDTLPAILTYRVAHQSKADESTLLGFLVMTDIGLPVFSKYYDKVIETQDVLLSGLISAVSGFIQSTLTRDQNGSLKSINHENVTILIERINQKLSLVFFTEKDTADLQLKLIQLAREIEMQAKEKYLDITSDEVSQGDQRNILKEIIESSMIRILPSIK